MGNKVVTVVLSVNTSFEGVRNWLARLVSEEVENEHKFNIQTQSRRGKKLACETSLRRFKNGLATEISESLDGVSVLTFFAQS